MGRGDGRVALTPGSAWEMLQLQLTQAKSVLLHPVPKGQSKEKDGMPLCHLERLFCLLLNKEDTAQCLSTVSNVEFESCGVISVEYYFIP